MQKKVRSVQCLLIQYIQCNKRERGQVHNNMASLIHFPSAQRQELMRDRKEDKSEEKMGESSLSITNQLYSS